MVSNMSVQSKDILNKFIIFKNRFSKSDRTKYKCALYKGDFIFIGVGPSQMKSVKACKKQIDKFNKGAN